MLRGRIEVVSHTSRALSDNPLGDPATRELVICLPPGYDDDRNRHYPVVVCLTGFTGAGYMMLNRSAWTPSLPERYEALLERGEASPMILVLPDCFTRLGGSQYLDSHAVGRYETYLLDEVAPLVESRFRCLPVPEGWGVMGKSSGGYGALVHGMKHPERFSAIACHSGDMYFEYCYGCDFPKAARTLEVRGGVAGFLSWFDGLVKKTNDALTTLNIVAMAACYSPRDPHPGPGTADLGIELPFSLPSARIRDEVWSRWLAHDPVRMLDRYAETLATRKLLFLDCGTRDEFHLQFGARIFVDGLRARGIRHRHEEFDDSHMNISYRYDRSLALLSEALDPRR